MSIPLSYVMSFETSSETRHYKVFPVSSPPPSLFLLNTYTTPCSQTAEPPFFTFVVSELYSCEVKHTFKFSLFLLKMLHTPFYQFSSEPYINHPKGFHFAFMSTAITIRGMLYSSQAKINSFIANSLSNDDHICIALRMPLH